MPLKAVGKVAGDFQSRRTMSLGSEGNLMRLRFHCTAPMHSSHAQTAPPRGDVTAASYEFAAPNVYIVHIVFAYSVNNHVPGI